MISNELWLCKTLFHSAHPLALLILHTPAGMQSQFPLPVPFHNKSKILTADQTGFAELVERPSPALGDRGIRFVCLFVVLRPSNI